ncbi:MAG: PQQ-binding-like beta-propeller repeat protein, partial [Gammaproteobacteria bacterium]
NWTINVKNEVLAPAAISARYVIVKTSAGELVGLNKTTGELIWSYRSQNPTLTVRGSSEPIIYEDEVFATFDNGRLGVFQLDTGFTLWDGAISYTEGTTELENLIDADSPPVVDGRLVYANNYQGNINIFDIAQKRSVWTAESSSFYSPLIIRGMMVLIQDDSSIKSFSTNTLLESWNSNEYKNRNLSNGVNFKGNIVF